MVGGWRLLNEYFSTLMYKYIFNYVISLFDSWRVRFPDQPESLQQSIVTFLYSWCAVEQNKPPAVTSIRHPLLEYDPMNVMSHHVALQVANRENVCAEFCQQHLHTPTEVHKESSASVGKCEVCGDVFASQVSIVDLFLVCCFFF